MNLRLSRELKGPCLVPQDRGSVVAIGAFDGLHLGHQALLAQVYRRAQDLRAEPAIISFEPLPRAFFAAEPVPRLSSMRDKLREFSAAGMRQVLLLRFNHALSVMPAQDFVHHVLRDRLAAREVWVGADFRFGHKRAGDVTMLQQMGEAHGFVPHIMPAVMLDGARVSASRIRMLLAAGEFAAVTPLLGHAFMIEGKVAYGKQLGRRLGYPTANIHLHQRITPIQGIFAVRVRLDDNPCGWPGVASLGVRPTINQLSQPLLEVHLFDFDGDLYGRRMAVEFVAKLRDEKKFDTLDVLQAQMNQDACAARQVLGMDPVLAET